MPQTYFYTVYFQNPVLGFGYLKPSLHDSTFARVELNLLLSKYLNPRYKTKSPLGIRKPFKKKHWKMKTFIIFSCFITMAFSACFTPNNFDCRRVTGTFPDPRDCGQSFVQVSTYASVKGPKWTEKFSSIQKFAFLMNFELNSVRFLAKWTFFNFSTI